MARYSINILGVLCTFWIEVSQMRIVDLFSGAGGLTLVSTIIEKITHLLEMKIVILFLRMNMIMRQQNRFVLISRILI